jgi:hypothetical protein
LGLTAEARLERGVACQVGAEDLNRDGASETIVVTDVYFGHASTADEFTDLVTTR